VTDDELSQLMRAAQAGDAVAYTSLLEAIAPRIRRVVGSQRHFAGAQEVEDLVQDVLLSVHAVRATYDPSRPFAPWLAAIVRNRLADGARRYARRSSEIAVDNLDVTFADPGANTSEEGYAGAAAGDPRPAAGPAAGGRAAEAAGDVAQGRGRRHRVEHLRAEGGHPSRDGLAAARARQDT